MVRNGEKMIEDLTFGELLRSIRESNEMSQRLYRDATGLDSGNLSRTETGILPPPINREKIMQRLVGLKYRPIDLELLIKTAREYHLDRVRANFQ